MKYQLLDSGDFWKLEQVGKYRLLRPSASAVWRASLPESEWKNFDAKFDRDSSGDGEWNIKNQDVKKDWSLKVFDLNFKIRLTGFGHLGLFPEQEKNWREMDEILGARVKPGEDFKVLNLFAYTGGSTLACARRGAQVVHLDASKTSVQWAKDNAEMSGLKEAPIRWIVDDVQDFVAREIRRGSKYQAFILDPPSYGRGPNKQMWKVEKDQMPLLENLKKLMADDFSFCLLSSHSPGYTPVALENQVGQMLGDKARFSSAEMLVSDSSGRSLPSGASCLAVIN
jgi:23S rRNA (cytosine1962-C5)-methyltransferase